MSLQPMPAPKTMADLMRLVEADDNRVRRERAEATEREKALKVAWLVARHPLLGGEYYRGYRPAMLAAARLGWHTAVCDRMGTIDEDGPLAFLTPGLEPRGIVPDVIVLRPIREWGPQWTTRARRAGQVVIADLDDDLWVHEGWDPDHRPGDDHYEEWCYNVDGWLVSTEAIRDRVIERHRAKRLRCPPVLVAPNCYDPHGVGGDWTARTPGRILGNRLWVSGRMSADKELWSLVGELMDELDLYFCHVGGDEQLVSSEPWHWGPGLPLPIERCEIRGSTVLPALHAALDGVSIGVICQGDHPYNAAKTETNAVELASMGLPLLALTNHHLYEDVPGVIRLGPNQKEQAKERLESLLDPAVWHREHLLARAWSEEVAARAETQHLEMLASLVTSLVRS